MTFVPKDQRLRSQGQKYARWFVLPPSVPFSAHQLVDRTWDLSDSLGDQTLHSDDSVRRL